MNSNLMINDAEEYDLESLENILLDWPMRCRTKVNKSSKGNSSRSQRVHRSCNTNKGEESRKTKHDTSKCTSKYVASKPPDQFESGKIPSHMIIPPRPSRPTRQGTHLQTVSILDTLVELAQNPPEHFRSTQPRAAASSYKNETSSVFKDRRPIESHALPIIARGRTPDWIKSVFELVKKGDAEKLLLTLKDMDAILIRNLSDQHGNNVFHACAWNGQVDCLKVLLDQGQECKDALYDENKQGFSPIVLSIKKGHLDFLKFLLEYPDTRERLLSFENSRPLIHWAAKYGQNDILKWLIEFMHDKNMNWNMCDGEGNTILHIASKFGHISCIKVLVENDVDLTKQNHIGHKPADTARMFGQNGCFEYLMALETSLLLSYDVSSLEEELHNIQMETLELKTHIKDVIACAKKTIKEKEELALELKFLKTQVNQANQDALLEMQALIEDGGNTEEIMSRLQKLCDHFSSMQFQLHENQNQSFTKATFADKEAKLAVAEDKWRRIKSKVNHANDYSKKPLGIFQERLRQVHYRNSSSTSFGDSKQLSTSESSISSIGSDGKVKKLFPPKHTPTKTQKTPNPRHMPKRLRNNGELKRVLSAPSIPGPAVPSASDSPLLLKLLGELTVSNLGPPLTSFADPDEVTCTVLEVIESLNSENHGDKKTVEPQIPHDISSKKQSEVTSNLKQVNDEKNVQLVKKTESDINASGSAEPKSCQVVDDELHVPSNENKPFMSSEPDLIKETKGVRAWETSDSGSVEYASKDSSSVGLCTSESCSNDFLRHGIPSSLKEFQCNSKRKRFLNKFAIKWPSKRKDMKTGNNEISPQDFKETYLAASNCENNVTGDSQVSPCNVEKDNSVCEADRPNAQIIKIDSKRLESICSESHNNIPAAADEKYVITLSDLADTPSGSAIFQLPLVPTKSANLSTSSKLRILPSVCKSEKNGSTESSTLRMNGFSLLKPGCSTSDLLKDSSTVSRASPTPSEVSKTESALFPPPSDLSHTESIRHLRQLGKIEEIVKRENLAELTISQTQVPQHKSPDIAVKTQEVQQLAGKQPITTGVKKKETEAKPWYDLSDDEDMLTPERLQSTGIKLCSSSEEEEHILTQCS